jgi:surface protein
MKNGHCKKIENFFMATYNVSSTTKPTHFLNLDQKFMTINDFDVFIDGRKVAQVEHREMIYGTEHYFLSYNFKKLGMHEVKIFFKRTPTNLRQLFYLCFDLTRIKFSDTFDTSKVQTMAYMFAKCTSLKSLDISAFDTSRVADYMQMFQYCSELTSLDLSNFNTTNAISFQSSFDSMTNLQYLDISSFYSPYLSGGYFINYSGNEKTTVVLNRKFGLIYIPSNWKRVYKE